MEKSILSIEQEQENAGVKVETCMQCDLLHLGHVQISKLPGQTLLHVAHDARK